MNRLKAALEKEEEDTVEFRFVVSFDADGLWQTDKGVFVAGTLEGDTWTGVDKAPIDPKPLTVNQAAAWYLEHVEDYTDASGNPTELIRALLDRTSPDAVTRYIAKGMNAKQLLKAARTLETAARAMRLRAKQLGGI